MKRIGLVVLLLLGIAPVAQAEYCREYTQDVLISGKPETAYGRACLQADNSWRVQSYEDMDGAALVPPAQVFYEEPDVVYANRGTSFTPRQTVYIEQSPPTVVYYYPSEPVQTRTNIFIGHSRYRNNHDYWRHDRGDHWYNPPRFDDNSHVERSHYGSRYGR